MLPIFLTISDFNAIAPKPSILAIDIAMANAGTSDEANIFYARTLFQDARTFLL